MTQRKLLYGLLALVLYSCTPKTNFPASDYYAFKETKTDKWGLVDANGKILVKDEFSEMPVGIYNGIFLVPTGSGVTMFSTKNPTLPIGEKYNDICPFFDDVTPSVKDDEVIKIIDKKGNVKFELPTNYTEASAFYYGYSIVYNKTTSLHEALSTSGDFIKSDKYDIMLSLSGDKFLAIDSEGENIFMINKKMEKITRFDSEISYITPDLKYYAYTDEDGNDGLKNISGEVVIRPKYENLIYVNEGCIIVQDEDDKYGVINIKGENIIRPKYKNVVGVKGNCIAVYDAEKERCGIIDIKGDVVLPFEYSTISVIPNSEYFVVKPHGDSYSYFVDKKGKKIDGMEYYELAIGNDGYGDMYELLSNWFDDQYIVESDYLDVADIVKVMLNETDGPLSQFTRFAGNSPEFVSESLGLSLTKDDISTFLDLEWLPQKHFKNNEYGSLYYTLGFDKIVEEYIDYNYYYYKTEYRFSSYGECTALYINLRLSSNFAQKESKILEGLEAAFKSNGYSKDTNYKTAVYNKEYTVFYNCENGEIVFVVKPRVDLESD